MKTVSLPAEVTADFDPIGKPLYEEVKAGKTPKGFVSADFVDGKAVLKAVNPFVSPDEYPFYLVAFVLESGVIGFGYYRGVPDNNDFVYTPSFLEVLGYPVTAPSDLELEINEFFSDSDRSKVYRASTLIPGYDF